MVLAIDVCDDGVGLSDSPSRQLGLEIVETLVREDLQGDWRLVGGGGTRARITIPLSVANQRGAGATAAAEPQGS